MMLSGLEVVAAFVFIRFSLQRGPGAPVHLPGVQSCVRAEADREVHRGERDGPDERTAAVRGAAGGH